MHVSILRVVYIRRIYLHARYLSSEKKIENGFGSDCRLDSLINAQTVKPCRHVIFYRNGSPFPAPIRIHMYYIGWYPRGGNGVIYLTMSHDMRRFYGKSLE